MDVKQCEKTLGKIQCSEQISIDANYEANYIGSNGQASSRFS